jgi:hypothetical protein
MPGSNCLLVITTKPNLKQNVHTAAIFLLYIILGDSLPDTISALIKWRWHHFPTSHKFLRRHVVLLDGRK